MSYELVYTSEFIQSPLYLSLVVFVRECNRLVPKMTCQGKKLFAGRIRWELGCMTQWLIHAEVTTQANKRFKFVAHTQQHFQVICGLLQLCCDLKYLPEKDCEIVAEQIQIVEKKLRH
jgi:hypothetical protein